MNQCTYFFQAVERQVYHIWKKKICDAILKTLFDQCKDPEKPRVFLLGPTGI